MKRRLTAVEWQSLCEHADGRREAGAAWHVIEEEAAAAGVCEEDLAELQVRHRQWIRGEQKRTAAAEELPAELPATAGDALSFSSVHEDTRKVAMYVFGPGILKAEPVWRGTVNRTLKKGDTVEICEGAGASWLVCAVIIRHADGTREIFPEHRVRQRCREAVRGRSKGETLRMQVLDLEEGFDTAGIVRRAAAVAYGYFAERSGIRNASHLADVSGVSRQAVHAGQVKLREGHKERAGKVTGLAGQVPSRRPGKGAGPKGRKLQNPSSNLQRSSKATINLTHTKL